MTQSFVVSAERRTDGLWEHTGRLVISRRVSDGTMVKLTLPDDWTTGTDLESRVAALESALTALTARVAALEARPVIDAVEDLKYGN